MHFEKYISLKIYNKYLIPKKIFVYNEYLEYERSLDLSSNNICDQYNTEPHFEYLPPIPKLSHLNLSYNNFNRNDMKIILDAKTELKTINFDRNVIDMEGLNLLIPSFETANFIL